MRSKQGTSADHREACKENSFYEGFRDPGEELEGRRSLRSQHREQRGKARAVGRNPLRVRSGTEIDRKNLGVPLLWGDLFPSDLSVQTPL